MTPVPLPRDFPRPARRALSLALVGLALVLAWSALGCGAGGKGGSADEGDRKAGAEASMAFDDGPADAEEAKLGATLFAEKGCSACHAFGRRLTGPDLAGATRRRSKDWLVRMIQAPDEMTKSDPAARELLGTYAVQMPRLNLTEEEAEALVEYLKTQDAPSGAK